MAAKGIKALRTVRHRLDDLETNRPMVNGVITVRHRLDDLETSGLSVLTH